MECDHKKKVRVCQCAEHRKQSWKGSRTQFYGCFVIRGRKKKERNYAAHYFFTMAASNIKSEGSQVEKFLYPWVKSSQDVFNFFFFASSSFFKHVKTTCIVRVLEGEGSTNNKIKFISYQQSTFTDRLILDSSSIAKWFNKAG